MSFSLGDRGQLELTLKFDPGLVFTEIKKSLGLENHRLTFHTCNDKDALTEENELIYFMKEITYFKLSNKVNEYFSGETHVDSVDFFQSYIDQIDPEEIFKGAKKLKVHKVFKGFKGIIYVLVRFSVPLGHVILQEPIG